MRAYLNTLILVNIEKGSIIEPFYTIAGKSFSIAIKLHFLIDNYILYFNLNITYKNVTVDFACRYHRGYFLSNTLFNALYSLKYRPLRISSMLV